MLTELPTELHWWSAHDLAAAIRERRVSAVEVLRAHLERIGAVDGEANAIVTLVDEAAALAAAAAADRAVSRGDALGPLHGLPIAVKDLMDVAGLRTTHGSLAHRDDEPAVADSLLAEQLRAAGALIIGKTNTPEYGTGVLTFNRVFGPTRNPYDLSRSAGGSSGGAGAALAAGMLPIADGSDSGGSIRVPAAFCNVVGLRPSAGRVPSGRRGNGWSPHGVLGPMARSVRDVGLMLAAIAGDDRRWPIALGGATAPFADVRPSDLCGVRVAFSHDVDGLPIDPEVRAVHARARDALVELGCVVEDVEPDLAGADACWETIEHFEFFCGLRADVAAHADVMWPDIVENVRRGERLTAAQLADAHEQRTEIYRRTARLLDNHDLLVLPAAPLPPPPVELEIVTEVDGVPMERYSTWQRCSTRITVTAHPVLALPGGFTPNGLPVGLQVVGRHKDELALLRHGAAIEEGMGLTARRPAL